MKTHRISYPRANFYRWRNRLQHSCSSHPRLCASCHTLRPKAVWKNSSLTGYYPKKRRTGTMFSYLLKDS